MSGGTVRSVRKGEDGYPKRFLGLPGMPELLYYLGSLPSEIRGAPCAAVVGARLCDRYGHRQAYEFGKALAESGVQVISGMALGIDTWALEGALDGGGRAFAVLGSGADVCYPRANQKLYERLIGNGGILSEFEPGTQPAPWHFPVRNRIISALSDLVLVVQAKKRSGSLITADYALEQGRAVYAVPGRVGDLLSEGCNRLIAQGAGIAYCPEMLLEELSLMRGGSLRVRAAAAGERESREAGGRREISGVSAPSGAEPDRRFSPEARKVLACLGDEPSGIDSVCRSTGLSAQAAAAALAELILSGAAEEAAPHFYARTISSCKRNIFDV